MFALCKLDLYWANGCWIYDPCSLPGRRASRRSTACSRPPLAARRRRLVLAAAASSAARRRLKNRSISSQSSAASQASHLICSGARSPGVVVVQGQVPRCHVAKRAAPDYMHQGTVHGYVTCTQRNNNVTNIYVLAIWYSVFSEL